MKRVLKLYVEVGKVILKQFISFYKIISDTYKFLFVPWNFYKSEYYTDIKNRLAIQKAVDELKETGEEFKEVTLTSGRVIKISIETTSFIL